MAASLMEVEENLTCPSRPAPNQSFNIDQIVNFVAQYVQRMCYAKGNTNTKIDMEREKAGIYLEKRYLLHYLLDDDCDGVFVLGGVDPQHNREKQSYIVVPFRENEANRCKLEGMPMGTQTVVTGTQHWPPLEDPLKLSHLMTDISVNPHQPIPCSDLTNIKRRVREELSKINIR